MRIDPSSRRRVWIVTDTGVALHAAGCDRIADALSTVAFTRREAVDWLARGDRRFLCLVCKPGDPRMRVLTALSLRVPGDQGEL